MADKLTVDDFGIQHSNRYAQDKQLYLESKETVQQSYQVAQQTTTDVLEPCYESSLDMLIGNVNAYRPWALFAQPESYGQNNSLFRNQAIPSLGSKESIAAKLGKLEQLYETETNKQNTKNRLNQIISMIKFLQSLDSQIAHFVAKRSQFSKG